MITNRHRAYVVLAAAILILHLAIAAIARPSFTLTITGDALPCALLVIAILAVRENLRHQAGLIPVFWKLVQAGFLLMLLSQGYWFFYDSLRRYSSPSPVPGDALFFLAHVFFLAALALRPHSAAAGRDLRIRRLDLVLLTLWWFCLYCYYALPWQSIVRDFSRYNPADYVLVLIQQLVIIATLAVLCYRNPGPWRRLYAHLIVAFSLIAAGSLLLSVAIDRGFYYSGGFIDTPFLIALFWFTLLASFGPGLTPREDVAPNRELKQSVWTARVAMLAILSLPVIGLFGFFERGVPAGVAEFRLRFVFGAMFLLGSLVFWKLNLLTRELAQLVRLTSDSIANLKSVQEQVTHSQKLSALGRLAAGAAHEISNPLTAILGYSELLSDIPSLSPEDRESTEGIQLQVHRAQAAVTSLRDTLRGGGPSHPILVEKAPPS